MSQQTMTTNGYFGPGLFRFLRDLKTHNEREWFQANKQRYEADVQAPFLRLIADLAPCGWRIVVLLLCNNVTLR